MARPDKDIEIDYDCIAIKVDGRVNGSSNPRCTKNNDNSDGFVYTSSTYKDAATGKYKYNYLINVESGVYTDIIKDAGATDRDRAAMAIRNGGDSSNEGTINLGSILDSKAQFNGFATEKTKFFYNEGNSSTVGNGKTESKGKLQDESEYDVTGFYDTQTDVFSDQLTNVRKLTPAASS